MHSISYRYVLELLREDGKPIARVPASADWEPATECARFTALRHGRLSAAEEGSDLSVLPVWHETSGPPYLSGFQVCIDANGSGPITSDFPITYWHELAQDAGSLLVTRGTLRADERFFYRVLAYECDAATEDRPADSFLVEKVSPPLPVTPGDLSEYLSGSTRFGPQEAGDMPVVIPPQVLSETASLAKGADGLETGGVLIGHLHRDESIPEIFARVTAQVPARHTTSSSTRLRFTAETWADVRAAIALRSSAEIRLGWWHSHPVRHWRDHENEAGNADAAGCSAGDFFSAEDCALHRTVFPAAYSVGLVVSDVRRASADWTTAWSLFGWRSGVIQARGFNLLAEDRAVA